jgi:acylphosphatase
VVPSIRIIVEGRVQGVGFRAFAATEARRLGISGEVWNRADGAVEIIAVHAQTAMLTLLSTRLENGPGRVQRVILEAGPDTAYSDFTVRRGTVA